MKERWCKGNRARLLQNEEFFWSVFATMARAQHEILLETFILFDDRVGQRLRQVLIDAAQRGLRVECTVDGWGSPNLSRDFIEGLTAAGVSFRLFDPLSRLFGRKLKLFRRLHRKLVVVDRRFAYVGGINFSEDHLQDYGPEAKQDYAVELEGPIVRNIHAFLESRLVPPRRWHPWLRWPRWRRNPADGQSFPRSGEASALFVVRDNDRHRTAIERQYRAAIRAARREVIIANAYFFPGFRLLHDLRNAARRGVEVRLILQGRPDEPIARVAARLLYRRLSADGVRIFEYCRCPLHGKVAVIDGVWATVGSSNLDPLSLSLNLEANVMIRDPGFGRHLREHLLELIGHHCEQISAERLPRGSLWQSLGSVLAFHAVRRFPAWAGLLPAHTQRVAIVPPPEAGGVANPELVPLSVTQIETAEPDTAPPPSSSNRPAA